MTTPLEAEGHQSLKAESDSPALNGIFDDHPDNLPAHSTDRPRTNGQKETAAISPDTPDELDELDELDEFDWQDFEARYKAALLEANEEEKAILKEAESLSQFFQSWASAASAHDDRRAVKRLQTRQRFVHLSEEKLAQKQQHYVEVVRAFETALALLKTS